MGIATAAASALLVAAGALTGAPAAGSVPRTTATAATTHQSHLPGTKCTVFPANNVWNTPIDKLPVNKHSAQWVKNIGRGDLLHPDFGPSYGAQPVPYGIPITVVGKNHPKVHVKFLYSSESDHVRYPLGSDTRIEGGKHAGGDRHAIVVDKATCVDYETWLTRHTKKGWTAGSGAVWHLDSNKLRYKPGLDLGPNGLTSADAAGLPILPGLLRPGEVKAGYVDHAIRFTAPVTSEHFIWPAEHEAGSKKSLAYPPMGARFRLKASFSLKGFSHDTKVVLRAMKTFGLILADNGSPWYFQGAASNAWSNTMIAQLKTIPASAFQAVDESSLRVAKHSGEAR
ncbi:MAG TPA: hypothetical protein VME70_03595 [Mycobacteriales bacterium]|nr:hypothetical protein [Mycobacteriales bacterium]